MTSEHRKMWKDILYVPNDHRYWTFGENYARWLQVAKILFGPGDETKASREQRAEESFGTINGPPIPTKWMSEYPELLLVRFLVPIFHAKIHFCTNVITRLLTWMCRFKTPGHITLLHKLENQRDSLEHGKLSTNASGLFQLSKRFAPFFFQPNLLPLFFC